MSTRLHVVMPDELVARIDEVLGPGQPRADFIRRAVEQALDAPEKNNRRAFPGPAPAERPLGLAIQQAARSSRQAKDFKPYPKGKR